MLFQKIANNFIGREKELGIFAEWLVNPVVHWILYFYDALEEREKKGGVGKTWLLRMCATRAKQINQNIAVVMIDFFNVADRDGIVIAEQIAKELQAVYPEWHPTSFATAIQEYRSATADDNLDTDNDIKLKISAALRVDLHQLEQQLFVTGTYLLVFFDTFEVIEKNPAIAVLQPSQTFPDSYHLSRIRIVMAGRSALDWTHPNWLGREKEMLCVPLKPFDQAEMLQYLDRESIYTPHAQSEQAAALYTRTDGRPILIGLAIDILNHHILTLDELVAVPPSRFEPYLVAQINNLENPLNWIILFMAHVYHRFNVVLLERVLCELSEKDLVSYVESAPLLAKLPELSFVRSSEASNDFVLHDEMRRLVTKYCWDVQDPDRSVRKEISRYVINYYEEVMQEQNGHETQASIIEILYHHLFIDVTAGFTYFQKHFSKAIKLAINPFARSLQQETQMFGGLMSEEQRNEMTLTEIQLLRTEERAGAAITLCEKLESKHNEQWFAKQRAELLFEKGTCYLALSKLPEATTCLMYSLKIERARGSELRCATILNLLGIIYRRRGQFDAALNYYEECIAIYKKLGKPRNYADALNNMSNVHRVKGRITEAIRGCKIAWRIRSDLFQEGQTTEFSVGLSLTTMGRIYLDAKSIVEAEQCFQDAYEIFLRTGYRKGIATVYNRFGQIQMAKGDWQKALEWFEKALDASIDVDAEAHVYSLNKQGRVLARQNRWKEAIPFFKRALELAEQIRDDYQFVECLIDLAEAQEYLGQHYLSQQSFQKATERSDIEKYFYLAGRTEEIRGNLEYKASNYQAAFEHYRKYCQHMASYNTLEYNAALDKLVDRLVNIPRKEIFLIVDALITSWVKQKLDRDYPELIDACKEVETLLTF